MNRLFAFASFAVIIGVTIPYIRDIIAGRAKPARAARVMFFIMLVLALGQQHALGSGLALAVTIGEFASSAMLLGLAMKYGVGGWSRSDIICYLLLALDLAVWLTTKNSLLSLHLTVLADMVSFWPTLHKTWHDPRSETPLFFWGGVIAPLLSVAAGGSWTYAIVVFPLYLALANAVELTLIYRTTPLPVTP